MAILHMWAYPIGPYKVWRRPKALENHVVPRTRTYTGVGLAIVAVFEMVSVWDLIEGIGRAFKYMFMDFRHRHHEIGYVNQHVQGMKSSHWYGTYQTSQIMSFNRLPRAQIVAQGIEPQEEKMRVR